jgi:hypothetical protein
MIITRGFGPSQNLSNRGFGPEATSTIIVLITCARLFDVIPRNRIFDAIERGYHAVY